LTSTIGTKRVVRRFLSFAREYLRYYVFAAIGIALVSAASGASAYLVKPVLDDIFIKKDTVMLGILPFAIILVYFAKGAGSYIQAYYTSFIGQDIVRKLRNNLLDNILSLDIAFFNRQRSGELISRVTGDIGRVQSFVASTVPDLVREALTVVALLCVVIFQSAHLAFYFIVIMPLALYPLALLAKKMKKISHKSQGKVSDLTSRLTEIFNNVEIIKANNSERFEVNRFSQTNMEFFHLSMKSTRTNQLVSPLMETLGAIAIATVIIMGGHEVIEDKMSVGSFFSFITALFMLYTPIKRVSNIYNSMQEAIAAGERVFDYLDKRPQIVGGNKELMGHISSLSFENVRLSFDDKEALKGVNLSARAGQKIALVGDSGGGKSSCVNLILRFYAPSEGVISFDGVDVGEYSLASIRAKVAVVTQRIYIFNDTVAQNVAYGKEIDRDKVVDALRRANAWEFVEEMPQGIDTTLDEFGVNLSGGQRQRIAIARAIYKDPDILILDEATSALDNKSEEKVQEAIDAFSRDKITIIIAHRLSTIKNADKIAVLKHGKVVGEGTHEALLASCEEYSRLYTLAVRQ
jgi:ATP-binding cassette, subfamily B, bacterial MsbA